MINLSENIKATSGIFLLKFILLIGLVKGASPWSTLHPIRMCFVHQRADSSRSLATMDTCLLFTFSNRSFRGNADLSACLVEIMIAQTEKRRRINPVEAGVLININYCYD